MMVSPIDKARSTRPVRVMLVDDNPDDRLLMKEAFAGIEGLELSVVVEDGASALAGIGNLYQKVVLAF
jgi:CheY-like chemotaxis protein